MKFNFFIPCQPPRSTGSNSKQFNTVTKTMFTSEKHMKVIDFLTSVLRTEAPERPLDGPILVNLSYVFPLTKSDTQTKKMRFELGEFQYILHDKKPDIDNIQKSLYDVMSSLNFWINDSRICITIVSKFRAEKTGIYMTASELPKSFTREQFEELIGLALQSFNKQDEPSQGSLFEGN